MKFRCLYPSYDSVPQDVGSGLEKDGNASDIEGMRTEGNFPEWTGWCLSLVAYHQRYCRTRGSPLQIEVGMKERSRDEHSNGYLHVRRHDSNLCRIDDKIAEPKLIYVVCDSHRTENGQQIQEIEVLEQPTLAEH
jgi:hypothetical protein